MPTRTVTDGDRLLFAAGFAFGVLTTLLMLVVVLAAVTPAWAGPGGVVGSPVFAPIAAGVLFVGIVGVGLYLLSFPDNRTKIPVDPGQFGFDDEE